MKKLILFSLFLGISSLLFSQQDSPLPVPHKLAVLPHSGQMSLGVELFNLADPDFSTSVSLNYLSDGFMPMSPSGAVGNNWSLSIGGRISRQIVGIADDVNHVLSHYEETGAMHTFVDQKGLFTLIKDSAYHMVSYDQLFSGNFPSEQIRQQYTLYTENTHERDYLSDIYYFSMFGHSGTFVIGLDGHAKIISGDFVEVRLDSMGPQRVGERESNDILSPSSGLHPNRSVIMLTDLNGYRYIFGGGPEALTYSIALPYFNNHSDDRSELAAADVSEWYLTKVIAPNGRILNFRYRALDPSDSLLPYSFQAALAFDTIASVANDYFYSNSLALPVYGENTRFPYWDYHYMLSRTPRLDSVFSSDGAFSVRLSYVVKDDSQYDARQQYSWGPIINTMRDYIPAQSFFLSDISFSNDSQELSRWHFSYTTQAQACSTIQYRRQYLAALLHNSGLSYNFQYNLSATPESDAPYSDWESLDRMGYYITNPTIGTLSSMIDPLGCHTSFSYSRCRYDSVRIAVRSASGLRSSVQSTSENRLNNSVVISEIVKTDGTNRQLARRQYEYGEFPDRPTYGELPQDEKRLTPSIGDFALGESSGVLNVDFAMDVTPDGANSKQYIVRRFESPGVSSLASVEYSLVKEICLDANGRVLNKSVFYYDTTSDRIVTSWSYDDYEKFFDFYPYWSQSSERSRLWQIDRYDGTRLCKRETFAYPSVREEHCPYIAGRLGSWAVKMFYPSADWKSHNLTDFESNGQYSMREESYFDDKKRLVEARTYSPEKVFFSRNTYPDQLFRPAGQISDLNSLAYGYLWIRDRINDPVQTISGFVKDSIYYITEGSISLYKVHNWCGRIPLLPLVIEDNEWGTMNDRRKILSPPVLAPEFVAPCVMLSLNLTSPLPLTDYTPLTLVNGNVVWDNRFDTISSFDYDVRLRPISIHKQGQLPEIYEWDERGINILSKSQGIMHRSFTYIPYLGLSSETDERGVTVYYVYDSLGNITEVYRRSESGEKIILKTNMFHYNSQH